MSLDALPLDELTRARFDLLEQAARHAALGVPPDAAAAQVLAADLRTQADNYSILADRSDAWNARERHQENARRLREQARLLEAEAMRIIEARHP